jgi:prepilin-type N-terminal cleavage/methylation domain-containing protein
MSNKHGFALIELMAVIVLVGIIASFSTFFLYTGFNGYLNTKNATEGALNAQMALDRISMELRSIRELTGTPSNTSLSFKGEDSTEIRTLKYENQTVYIRVDTTDHILLENIPSFSICKLPPKDLDNNGSDDVPYIEVEFRVGLNENEIGKWFKTRIFPRHMVEDKWPDNIQCEAPTS